MDKFESWIFVLQCIKELLDRFVGSDLQAIKHKIITGGFLMFSYSLNEESTFHLFSNMPGLWALKTKSSAVKIIYVKNKVVLRKPLTRIINTTIRSNSSAKDMYVCCIAHEFILTSKNYLKVVFQKMKTFSTFSLLSNVLSNVVTFISKLGSSLGVQVIFRSSAPQQESLQVLTR